MSILIEGVEMPKNCSACPMLEGDRMDGLCHAANRWLDDDEYWTWYVYPEGDMDDSKPCNCPLVPVPPHGRLIDADALRTAMYHEAFETDTPMQRWDSGCWIRYKMFERVEESSPTIIPASEEGET